tara:strand:+ start:1152 stop:1490 length:339 start_codon:yes stop_codon:yes gene_type:complete
MNSETTQRTSEDIIADIKNVLDNYVQPAVEQHGGQVNFLDFTEGILTLEMSGACSGCAGSLATLQHGIEGMMMHYVPEVISIQAEHDQSSTVDPYYSHSYDYFEYNNFEDDY